MTDYIDNKLIRETISKYIRDQVPNFVNVDYEMFVRFMELYYEWLEQEGNLYDRIYKFKDNTDVDYSVDLFFDEFKEQYLKPFPKELYSVNREETDTFTVEEDLGGISYACACEGDSFVEFVDSNDTKTVDAYPVGSIRSSLWFVSVRISETGKKKTFQVLSTINESNEVFYTLLAGIGDFIDFDFEVSYDVDNDRVELNFTNNESNSIRVTLLRAPTFIQESPVGPSRNYMLSKEINKDTVVVVDLNGDVLVPDRDYSIANIETVCDLIGNELTINDSVNLESGDEITVRFIESKSVDERLLIKNLKRILSAKGTEKSYKLLFKLLYNEEIDINYPGQNILIASGSTWVENENTIKVSSTGAAEDFNLRTFKVYRFNTTLSIDEVIGSGSVDKVSLLNIGENEIAEFIISNIEGDILADETLVNIDGEMKPRNRIVSEYDVDGETVRLEETIKESATNVTITEPGSGYRVGTRVVIDGVIGDYAYISSVDTNGAIQKITVIQAGLGRAADSQIDLTSIGDGNAIAQAVDNVIIDRGKKWITFEGHISDLAILQDGGKNQTYSYVIQSARTLDQYKEIVKKLIHPSGLALFSEVVIRNCADWSVKEATYRVIKAATKLYSQGGTSSTSTIIQLGPRYRSFEENKFRYESYDGNNTGYTQIKDIESEVIETFENTPDKKFKFLLDSEVTVTNV